MSVNQRLAAIENVVADADPESTKPPLGDEYYQAVERELVDIFRGDMSHRPVALASDPEDEPPRPHDTYYAQVQASLDEIERRAIERLEDDGGPTDE